MSLEDKEAHNQYMFWKRARRWKDLILGIEANKKPNSYIWTLPYSTDYIYTEGRDSFNRIVNNVATYWYINTEINNEFLDNGKIPTFNKWLEDNKWVLFV